MRTMSGYAMVGGTIPPQSDSGEISRVLVLNLLWQSKRCSRTAQDISVLTTPSLLVEGHPRPQRLKPVSLVCLNRSAEALRHPNSAAPTHQSKTGIDGDPGCSATQVHSAAATPFRKEARKGCTRRLSRLRLRGNAWILRGSPSRGEGLRCLRMTMGKGRVLGR